RTEKMKLQMTQEHQAPRASLKKALYRGEAGAFCGSDDEDTRRSAKQINERVFISGLPNREYGSHSDHPQDGRPVVKWLLPIVQQKSHILGANNRTGFQAMSNPVPLARHILPRIILRGLQSGKRFSP